LSALVTLPIALPLLAGTLCVVAGRRARISLALVASLGTAAVAVALALEVGREGPYALALGAWLPPLGIRLYADGLSAFMVALQAAVGAGISVYAITYFAQERRAGAFWSLWLLLWAALSGLYLTGDLFNAYVTLELVGVAAVGLVAMAGGEAVSAALRYLIVTLIGSLLYLAGVALIYAEAGAVDLAVVAEVLPGSRAAAVALALMTTGLLLKTAAFPLHFWLPPAHANAPAPASAILSALVVKGSFYLVVRLWQSLFAADLAAALAELVGLLGVAAVVWGSAQALVQSRIKMLVAYSTVAQVGYLFLAFPLGPEAWRGAIYFAASHAFAKAAMFLAAGTMLRELGHDDVKSLGGAAGALPVTLFAFALAGVAIIGLPPSGGFVGKWILLVEAAREGRWLYVLAIPVGTLLAVGYVFRVVNLAFAEPKEPAPRRKALALEVPTLALAAGAIALGFASAPLLALLEVGAPLEAAP
jgi:multicomponent Na+:H+ antiporter subunit D